MFPSIRECCFISLVASAVLAGCTSDQPDQEPEELDEVIKTCSILLNRPLTNGTYVMHIEHEDWTQNAPLYAAMLEERGNDTSIHDLHADCDEPHEAEIEWLASRYWETPGARTTNGDYHFFITQSNATHLLEFPADYYDLPLWPPQDGA